MGEVKKPEVEKKPAKVEEKEKTEEVKKVEEVKKPEVEIKPAKVEEKEKTEEKEKAAKKPAAAAGNDPFNLGGILKLAKGLGAVGSGGFGAKKIVDAAKKFWEEIGDAPIKAAKKPAAAAENDPFNLGGILKLAKGL